MEDRERDCQEIFDRLKKMRIAKGLDYAGHDDSLANMRRFGWKGVMVRLFDKLERLSTLSKTGEAHVKSESMLDTMEDAFNYMMFMILLYEQEQTIEDVLQQVFVFAESDDREN